MLLDNKTLYSDDQAITTTAVSTNYINHGAPGTPPGSPAALSQDLGGANEIELLIQVTEAFAGGTNLQAVLQGSTDAAFTSPVTLQQSPAIVTASLTQGKKLPMSVIAPGATYQFTRINYVVSGTHTAGKITASVAAGLQTNE